jgi:hypothetical protein
LLTMSEPVVDFAQPINVGLTKPPMSAMLLINAMPRAAAEPDR